VDLLQTQAQRIVDDIAVRGVTAFAQPIKRGGNVFIQGQGGAHVAHHALVDALMSMT
jgi:hypothetical protein